jgi:hypothetical protein
MQTRRVRRVLANAMGFATLAAFAIFLSAVFLRIDVAIHNWPTAAGAFGVLAITSYKSWIALERMGAKWGEGVLISIGLAVVLAFLPVDILLGRLVHPRFGVIDSTVSTLSFWLTVLICPMYTCCLLSGWARSVVLRGWTHNS